MIFSFGRLNRRLSPTVILYKDFTFIFRLTLAQLLDCVEEDDDIAWDVYIVPPDDNNETEEDSAKSDEVPDCDVNNLPRGILNKPCEVVF